LITAGQSPVSDPLLPADSGRWYLAMIAAAEFEGAVVAGDAIV
jgi:hypothetical protein